jgi:hypothetical protein
MVMPEGEGDLSRYFSECGVSLLLGSLTRRNEDRLNCTSPVYQTLSTVPHEDSRLLDAKLRIVVGIKNFGTFYFKIGGLS